MAVASTLLFEMPHLCFNAHSFNSFFNTDTALVCFPVSHVVLLWRTSLLDPGKCWWWRKVRQSLYTEIRGYGIRLHSLRPGGGILPVSYTHISEYFQIFVFYCSSNVFLFFLIMGPQASEKCLPLRYLCLLSPSWTDKRRERGGPGARKEGHDIYLTDGQGEAGWKDRLTRKHLACLTPLQMHQIWGEVNREGTQTEWENDSSWIKGEKRLKSKLNWHLFLMFFQENSFIQILLFSPPFFPLSHFHRLEKCIDFWKVV